MDVLLNEAKDQSDDFVGIHTRITWLLYRFLSPGTFGVATLRVVLILRPRDQHMARSHLFHDSQCVER